MMRGTDGKDKEEGGDTPGTPVSGKKKSVGRPISKAEDEGFELVFDILFGIRDTVRCGDAEASGSAHAVGGRSWRPP